MRATARVWSASASGPFPEQTAECAVPPRLTGVCISGGSTRSFAAAVGILRGLTTAGLMERVGYLSAVSGGAWAAVPYTYYRGGAADDVHLLGEYEEPHELVLSRLEHIRRGSIATAATANFERSLAAASRDPGLGPDRVWSQAVGETFLAPFGMVDPERPAGFTLDSETARDIVRRNPKLDHGRLLTVWPSSYRPYLLVHSTLSWPPGETDVLRATRVGFEYAPLAIGAAPRRLLGMDGEQELRVGGGFVESFAFGATPMSVRDRERGLWDVELPARAFSLVDVVGASSAFRSPDRPSQTYPRATCWPVDPSGTPRASSHVFTDGGDLENYGLLALLQRGVRAVVVFINTAWPLSLEYDPASWPEDIDERFRTPQPVDPSLAPLFGADSQKFAANTVFHEQDFATVVGGLQRAKRAGRTVMTTTEHRVLSNPAWGISGGWDVRVCWVYNEQVEAWTERLPESVQALVRRGQTGRSPETGQRGATPAPSGPVARFPHYLTREQNAGALIQLTSLQVNLLAHLSSWNVVHNRDALAACLGAP